MQACDDFLDELLSHEVAGDGRVPDIRYYLDSEQEATSDMGRSHNIGWQHSWGFSHLRVIIIRISKAALQVCPVCPISLQNESSNVPLESR